MNIGQKINQFELTDQTVKTFNALFTNSKLKNFSDDDIVEIGEIHSSDYIRFIEVNGTKLIVNLYNNMERKPYLVNPIVVLYNSNEEKIFNSKLKACEFLKVCENKLNIARSYDEQIRGYFVEYKDRNELTD